MGLTKPERRCLWAGLWWNWAPRRHTAMGVRGRDPATATCPADGHAALFVRTTLLPVSTKRAAATLLPASQPPVLHVQRPAPHHRPAPLPGDLSHSPAPALPLPDLCCLVDLDFEAPSFNSLSCPTRRLKSFNHPSHRAHTHPPPPPRCPAGPASFINDLSNTTAFPPLELDGATLRLATSNEVLGLGLAGMSALHVSGGTTHDWLWCGGAGREAR